VAVDGATDGPLLFSVKGASEALGVSRGSMYGLINAGEIEHIRIGRGMLISRGALDRFIETNTRVGWQG
jgi:excisionase family DNA binding protein